MYQELLNIFYSCNSPLLTVLQYIGPYMSFVPTEVNEGNLKLAVLYKQIHHLLVPSYDPC